MAAAGSQAALVERSSQTEILHHLFITVHGMQHSASCIVMQCSHQKCQPHQALKQGGVRQLPAARHSQQEGVAPPREDIQHSAAIICCADQLRFHCEEVRPPRCPDPNQLHGAAQYCHYYSLSLPPLMTSIKLGHSSKSRINDGTILLGGQPPSSQSASHKEEKKRGGGGIRNVGFLR